MLNLTCKEVYMTFMTSLMSWLMDWPGATVRSMMLMSHKYFLILVSFNLIGLLYVIKKSLFYNVLYNRFKVAICNFDLYITISV